MVDDNGRCYLNLDDDTLSKTWKCDLTCRALDSEDKQIIIDLNCDDSIENVTWMMVVNMVTSTSSLIMLLWKSVLMNHLTLIHLKKRRVTRSSGYCTSQLYIFRAAAVHYPILRTLLNYHCGIRDIESGLSEGSVSSLKKLLKVQELSELLDDEQLATTEGECLSTSESHLEVEFVAIIEAFMIN